MERLRVEFLGETLDLFLVDPVGGADEQLADVKVVEIEAFGGLKHLVVHPKLGRSAT